MKVRIGERFARVPRNMISIAPTGERILFVPGYGDAKFFREDKGLLHKYYDPNLGLADYQGRSYLVTEATTYVRDGVDYTVYLPSENKFLRRPALEGDSAFQKIDFATSGRFAPEFTVRDKLFSATEPLSRSQDLVGTELYTRSTGEIFVKDGDSFVPYVVESSSIRERFIRLDIILERNGSRDLITLFFQPGFTKGANLWMDHFGKTEDIACRCSKFGTALIRSENVIFYAGEADLENRVSALYQTVEIINRTYISKLDSSNEGKLHIPTQENISSDLLNQLHYEFEAFGERFKSIDFNEKAAVSGVYGAFCRLNDQIHACEGALANRNRKRDDAWWSMHASFMPDSYAMLPDDVYPEYTLDWKFGTLYMGYHTLGKDFIAAFWNNDLELFERKEIRPQRISSCELFVYLGPGTTGQIEDMEAWWKANNISNFGFNWGDPANAIGYIPVAHLVTYGLSPTVIKEKLVGSVNLAAASLYDQ